MSNTFVKDMFKLAAQKSLSVSVDSTKAIKLKNGSGVHVCTTVSAVKVDQGVAVKRSISSQGHYPADGETGFNLACEEAMADGIRRFCFGEAPNKPERHVVKIDNDPVVRKLVEEDEKAAKSSRPSGKLAVADGKNDVDVDEDDDVEPAKPKRGRGRPKKDKNEAPSEDEIPAPKTSKPRANKPEAVKYQIGDATSRNALKLAATDIWGDSWDKNPNLFAAIKAARPALVGTPALQGGEVTKQFVMALHEEVGPDYDVEDGDI